ncbi:MAG TPA: glycogen/starch synthase [Dehalococcoidia bacterium]|nr:glycogen/starch synthase [Dehalococcoidia bacterium]
MNVLFASIEMSPLAKVGGLGDVAGSLPRALREAGADVRIAMPMHGAIDRTVLSPRKILDDVKVPWPGGDERVDLWTEEVRGVPVYLIENRRYFGRETVYGFDDDPERFLFFCDALLACAPHLGFTPDVVHAQDWHTGFLLARLAQSEDSPWSGAGRVYTIHNLGLQGNFDEAFAHRHGLTSALTPPPPAEGDEGLTAESVLSGMALGIIHAGRVNTVSATYAREILTPEYGAGLDPLLRARADALSGIVNGIDYDEFNPATDPAITQHYDADSIGLRAANKRALQQEAGLPQDDEAVLFGVVARLWAQKGIDLVPPAFGPLLASGGAQLAVLGTGDEAVHAALLDLERRHPHRVKVWLAFDPPLGQRIYAGCDVFLMPSRYEPCGLGQLISLRYGAVPLVRRTGGLVDTVQDAGTDLQSGNGFTFGDATPEELREAAERAVAAFARRDAWRAMQERGMRQDWSWGRAASQYLALYREASDEQAAAAEL